MRYILIALLLFMSSCCPSRFEEPCSIDAYGIIEFYNFTDEYLTAFIQQRYNFTEVEPPLVSNVVEPHTIHRYRVHPGYYMVGVRLPNEKVFITKEPVEMSACRVYPMVMREGKKEEEKFEIQPRRSVAQ